MRLRGKRRYMITLKSIPTVNQGFWSITAYNAETGVFDSDQGKPYSFGNNLEMIKLPLDIHIQYDSPGHGIPWVPIPSGKFYVVFRIYSPIDKFEIPPIRRVKSEEAS